MANPFYVTQRNIFFSDVSTNVVPLTGGAVPLYVLWDALDEVGRYDLNTMIMVNGGVVPFGSTAPLLQHVCLNGKLWYYVYEGLTVRQHTPLQSITGGGGTASVTINDVAVPGSFASVLIYGAGLTGVISNDILTISASSGSTYFTPSDYAAADYVL